MPPLDQPVSQQLTHLHATLESSAAELQLLKLQDKELPNKFAKLNLKKNGRIKATTCILSHVLHIPLKVPPSSQFLLLPLLLLYSNWLDCSLTILSSTFSKNNKFNLDILKK